MIVMTSMIKMESLFGPFFDEYFNGENQVVSKSSCTTADAPDKRQQQPDLTSSTSTLATTVTADGNFDFDSSFDLQVQEKNTSYHQVKKYYNLQNVDKDKETTELQSLIEVFLDDEEEVAIDDVPLATKPPTIVDWKIYKDGKKSYYQVIRADGKS
ncbi:hypothetical protein Tco_0769784 [Tanacetum coccineum]|uniref:Uncharacterized protein n=1 Tax=Tanacetum coccineum TaxID=301880 RepID=A0ABQ4ZAC4_9ASTR